MIIHWIFAHRWWLLAAYVVCPLLKRLFWPSIRELWLLLGDEIRLTRAYYHWRRWTGITND